ncbi:MAG: outer membrane lipoprotein chaperone LolA [Pseudohongiellaceae bacterium]
MARSRLIRHSLIGFSMLLGASNVFSNEIATLDDLLSDIQTLSADVLQLIVEANGGVLEESSIKMQLKKPDGFYWETIDPFPELIVTNGAKLWNYQPDLEQVVIEDWDSERSELAAQLLSGQTENLRDEYTVENLLVSESTRAKFRLTPIAPDNIYENIDIAFLDSNLESISMQSKNGERTVWNFADVVRNQPIDDSTFVFVVPAGIEVIEDSYNQ